MNIIIAKTKLIEILLNNKHQASTINDSYSMEHDNETPLAYESCHQFLNEEQHQQEPVHNDNMDNYMITEEQRMHFEQMDAETLASSQPVSGVLGGARQVDTWSLSSSQQDSRANDSTKRCREAYKREVPRLFNIIQKNRNTLQQLNRDLHGICQHYLGLLSLPRDTDVLTFPQFDQVNRERLAALEDLETNFQGFKLEKKGKWSKGYQVPSQPRKPRRVAEESHPSIGEGNKGCLNH